MKEKAKSYVGGSVEVGGRMLVGDDCRGGVGRWWVGFVGGGGVMRVGVGGWF